MMTDAMIGRNGVGFILVGTLILLLGGLSFFVLQDTYIKKRHRKTMLLVIAGILVLIVQNCVENYLAYQVNMPLLRTILSVIGYSLRPVILILFFGLVDEEKSYTAFWLVAGVNATVYMTSFFSKISFWYDDNHFQRGPLAYCCHVVSLVLLLYFIYLTLRRCHRLRKRERIFPVLNVLLIAGSIVIEQYWYNRYCPVAYLTIAVVVGSLFYYIWLHMRFAAEHENALMAEHRIQIMMSQIQPHFLYNTLSTIQSLCLIEPEKAAKVTADFGAYLRQNLDTLSNPELISVRKELEHTRIYTEIEEVRFPHIHVDIEAPDTGFKLPALTIQPLVENAICHGGWENEDGQIRVTVREREDCHEITIQDDGKGFDVKRLEHTDETHIGIKNVRERIEQMCGGTLTVESAPGEGTIVRICIPMEGN